jgi:hypothetical protein
MSSTFRASIPASSKTVSIGILVQRWIGYELRAKRSVSFVSYSTDCQDTLHNQTYISDVVSFASLFEAFSFDMLQSLVQEMNLYAESPEDALRWLNVNLEGAKSRIDLYLIHQLILDGTDATSQVKHSTWRGNPATSDAVEILVSRRTWRGYRHWVVDFVPQIHLVSGNLTSGEYIFEDPLRRTRATLLRAQSQSATSRSKLIVQ